MTIIEHVRKRPTMYFGGYKEEYYDGCHFYYIISQILSGRWRSKITNAHRIDISVDGYQKISIRKYGSKACLVGNESSLWNFRDTNKREMFYEQDYSLVYIMEVCKLFKMSLYQSGTAKHIMFCDGKLVSCSEDLTTEKDGVFIEYTLDNSLFDNAVCKGIYLDTLCRQFAYMNAGLTINCNDRSFCYKEGLKDFVKDVSQTTSPVFRLKNETIEIAFTYTDNSDYRYYSFVNGHYTCQGGVHLEHCQNALLDKFWNSFVLGNSMDCTKGLFLAVNINLESPLFNDTFYRALAGTIDEHNSHPLPDTGFRELISTQFTEEMEDAIRHEIWKRKGGHNYKTFADVLCGE